MSFAVKAPTVRELAVLHEDRRHDHDRFLAVRQHDRLLLDAGQRNARAWRIEWFEFQRMIRSAANFQIDARVLLVIR